ncbi:MAG: metabolite traffic protein EboE [Kiritimatiellia bacterium]
MQIGTKLHLTYCTNIHPGNDWREVQSGLAAYGPQLKSRLSPDQPLGIGLRLSHLASVELLEGARLQAFKDQLAQDGLYVFTMNGFPYGSFHRERVKDMVHAPDWRTRERGDYTIRLAQILAALLPGDMDEGSISTSPLSYKPWLVPGGSADTWESIVVELVRVVQALREIEQKSGKYIHVDLEPEPDGLLETADEVCAFFGDHLLVDGAARLAEADRLSLDEAQQACLRHIGVCLDTCHMAIEYETPREYVEKFAALGIRIGKVQISSALRVPFASDDNRDGVERGQVPAVLAPYVESTYLHQVIQRNTDGALVRYPDLPDALEQLPVCGTDAREWRVHFHVPVFTESCGAFMTTQRAIVDTLRLLASNPFTRHLEIETYTWDVLPEALKLDLTESIVREFIWTQQQLAQCMPKDLA